MRTFVSDSCNYVAGFSHIQVLIRLCRLKWSIFGYIEIFSILRSASTVKIVLLNAKYKIFS